MKIMLDECVTQAAAIIITSFLQSDPEVESAVFSVDHIGGQGVKDSNVGRVAASEGWFIITADRDSSHKNSKKRLADGPL